MLTASYMCQPYTFLHKAINDHKYIDGIQYTDMTWHLLIWWKETIRGILEFTFHMSSPFTDFLCFRPMAVLLTSKIY